MKVTVDFPDSWRTHIETWASEYHEQSIEECIKTLTAFGLRQYRFKGGIVGIDMPDPTKDGSYLYFLWAEGFLKVGVSKDIKNRIKRLQTGCPLNIKLFDYYFFKDPAEAYKREKEIHILLAPKNTSGEWFNIDRPHAEMLDKYIEQHTDDGWREGL